MSDVGFTANDIEHVASLLAIICKFGALLFDETAEAGGSQLLDPNQLEQLAEVLGVDAYSLLDALTTTTTVVREETFVNAHSVDKVGERIGWDSGGAYACGCSVGEWLRRGHTHTACDSMRCLLSPQRHRLSFSIVLIPHPTLRLPPRASTQSTPPLKPSTSAVFAGSFFAWT